MNLALLGVKYGEFSTWGTANGLKKPTVETLPAQDLDTNGALLILLIESGVAKLDITLGKRNILAKAIDELRKDSTREPASIMPDPVTITTKSLAKDGGLEEILKKIEEIGSVRGL